MATLPFSWLPIVVAALAILYVQSSLGAKQCFTSNGDQTDSLPCYPDSNEDGPCCALGNICLSNGLCRPGPDVVNHGNVNQYRPDCTDQHWNTSNCFSGCNSFQGNGLKSCNDGKYCCYNMSGCNCSSTSLFNLGPATFVTTLPLSTIVPTSTPASTSARTTAATTSEATSHPPSTSSAAPTSTGESKSSNKEVAVGAGVGVGLGLPLIAMAGFMGYYFLRRRKRAQPLPYSGTVFAGDQIKPAELQTTEPTHEVAAYQLVPHISERYAHEASAQSPQEIDGRAIKPHIPHTP